MRSEPIVRLVDDDATVLTAQSMFLKMAGLKVVCYSSAAEFLENDDNRIDGCLLLDVRMPNMSGLELQDEMIRRKIDLPIIFLSAHGDIEMAVQAVHKGAKNFLVKPPKLETLLEEIESAIELNISNRKDQAFGRALMQQWNQLTEAEKENARMVAKGLTNQVIAEVRGISERTVRSQRASVYDKLEVENAAELAAFLHDLDHYKGLL